MNVIASVDVFNVTNANTVLNRVTTQNSATANQVSKSPARAWCGSARASRSKRPPLRGGKGRRDIVAGGHHPSAA